MSNVPKQTKRRDLIKRLKELGFQGPFKGSGPHPEFMVKDSLVLKLPNPHHGDIREVLLKKILQQAQISIEEWLR